MNLCEEGVFEVRLRRDIGGGVKPEAEALDGKRFTFIASWLIEGEDFPHYAGEWAMIPRDDSYPKNAPAWIASGDLIPCQP